MRTTIAEVMATAALAALIAPAGLRAQQDTPPLVQYRQNVMRGFQAHTGALRALVAGQVDERGHAYAHAQSVAGLAAMLGDLFPEGSMHDESRALAAIWERPDEFETRVAGIQSAASALLAAAASGDSERLAESLDAVNGACRSCHGTFRARPSR